MSEISSSLPESNLPWSQNNLANWEQGNSNLSLTGHKERLTHLLACLAVQLEEAPLVSSVPAHNAARAQAEHLQ